MGTNKWENRDALKTSFDEYINELKSVIDERTKYTRRAEGKPMATIGDPDNPHITNRGEHMRQTASEAIKIAKGLGLNETVVYIGMLMHDAGQPFGAHDGEKTMDIIEKLSNLGFYHHNAKGIDVVLSEDIIQKFIDAIPESKNNRELQNKLEDEAWYFLELIVGHDGESTSKDNHEYSKTGREYNSIKDAVLDKVAKANRINQYKCSVETLEAQISKPADIISYLKSDTLTGFSKGILNDLSDDYLALVGELLTESNEETAKIDNDIKEANSNEDREKIIKNIRLKRIDSANKILEYIKKDKLRETKEDIYSDAAKEIIGELNNVIEKLKEKGIEIANVKDNQIEETKRIIERIKQEYKVKKISEGVNSNIVISQIDKLDDYINKMGQTRKRVVEELMTKMQDALRNDYIETTLNNWKEIDERIDLKDEDRYKLKKQGMNFSDKVNKIIYGKNGIKDLNYREYVQYAKKVYQTGSLPKGVLKLVENCAHEIMQTGVIRSKFYDPEVISQISNGDLLELMHRENIDEEKNIKKRKQIGIIKRKASIAKKARSLKHRRFTSKRNKQKIERKNLYRKIYRYTQAQEARFARICEDIYFAIPYTVRNIVEKAVRSDYEPDEYLPEEEKNKIYEIRRELAERFGKYRGIAITKENLEEYINEQIAKERGQIETKVAIQECINYISGKTDIGIKDLLYKTGFISKKKLEKEDRLNEKGNKIVQKLSADLRGENRNYKKRDK